MVMKAISQVFVTIRNRLENIPEYKAEIDHVRNVLNTPLEQVDPWFFFKQYAYVVLCSYWKEQYARKEWEAFLDGLDTDEISNRRKREAIWYALKDHRYKDWFQELLKAPDKLEYLDTLPLMGPATRCHLARNIGIDCVKADRHMNRIAIEFGYGFDKNPYRQWEIDTKMCQEIQGDLQDGEKLGTIDVIFWRACNLGWL